MTSPTSGTRRPVRRASLHPSGTATVRRARRDRPRHAADLAARPIHRTAAVDHPPSTATDGAPTKRPKAPTIRPPAVATRPSESIFVYRMLSHAILRVATEPVDVAATSRRGCTGVADTPSHSSGPTFLPGPTRGRRRRSRRHLEEGGSAPIPLGPLAPGVVGAGPARSTGTTTTRYGHPKLFTHPRTAYLGCFTSTLDIHRMTRIECSNIKGSKSRSPPFYALRRIQ